MRYHCDICGYIYDEERGEPEGKIPPGTPWDEVPDDWVCPECGATKASFSALE